jgi:hypothetical protein
MPDNTANQNKSMLDKTQNAYFKFLKKQLPVLEGNYLEIGPDIGAFTKNCEHESQFKHIYLVEPNKNVHSELKASTGKIPNTISTDLFDLSHIPDQSITVCVMIHVLDHMINPLEMMHLIGKKLVKNGKVVIVTHDEKSFLAKMLKTRWPGFCLQHPHLFNVETTRDFLNRSSFSVINTEKTLNYFPIFYLLKHLFYALTKKKINIPNFDTFTIPLKLGNIITIAQKV